MEDKARFEFVQEGGTWSWILVGPTGENIATVDGFLTLARARRDAQRLKGAAGEAEIG